MDLVWCERDNIRDRARQVTAVAGLPQHDGLQAGD